MGKKLDTKEAARVADYLIKYVIPELKAERHNIAISLIGIGTALLIQMKDSENLKWALESAIDAAGKGFGSGKKK